MAGEPLLGCIEERLAKLESKQQWKEALGAARRWQPESWCGTCQSHDQAVKQEKIALYELKLGRWIAAKDEALKALNTPGVDPGKAACTFIEASFRLGSPGTAALELGAFAKGEVSQACLKEFDLLQKGNHDELLSLVKDDLKAAPGGWVDWEEVVERADRPERPNPTSRTARIPRILCLTEGGKAHLRSKIEAADKLAIFAAGYAEESSLRTSLDKVLESPAAKEDFDLRLLTKRALVKLRPR